MQPLPTHKMELDRLRHTYKHNVEAIELNNPITK